MENKEPQNCWEYWKCTKELKESCIAYITKSGKHCWLNMRTPHASANRGFKSCFDCPWYNHDLQPAKDVRYKTMINRVIKTRNDTSINESHNKHICLFYNSEEDLINTLVPFFKAGLKRNDFCMWITTEPLSVKSAKTALKKEIKDLDNYIENKQMEIIHYNNWYTKGGKFNPDEVLKGFIEKEKWALGQGFSGMRVSADGSWINDNDWSKVLSYERTVNNVINEHKIRAICSYRNDNISRDNTFHLDANHQLSLVNRKGEMSYFSNQL